MQIIKSNYRGFSLVEMAVVIVLIGVLMTFGIKLASSFQDRAAFTATHNKQILIKEALTSYLAQNSRLPCPADVLSPPTGKENITVATGTCNSNPGIIPYDTLGIPKDTAVDGWSRLFLYEVTNANHACATNWVNVSTFLGTTNTYHDGEVGCITIIDDQNGDGAITPDITRNNVVAVVVSNGPNGEGGYTAKGVLTSLDETVTTASREKDNIKTHSAKIAHTFHTEPTTLTGFDDVVLEISANDLLAPLKRDGTIVSINQVARDYFAKNVTVTLSTCSLLYPSAAPNPLKPLEKVSSTPATGVNQSPVLFGIVANGQTFNRTIVGADYGCPSGFNY